jgi:hypothetical protein
MKSENKKNNEKDLVYSSYFLYFGLLLYMLEIKVNPTVFVMMMLVFNVGFWTNSVLYTERWFGIDTLAYLN